jgi:TolB-like protein/tetratricopeptide (TPR) repeat protein
MGDSVSAPKVIRFGEFEVDLPAGRVLKRGVKVKLREQSFQVLSVLLEHAGEVVSREQLQQRLWPGEPLVDVEINLNTAIARLREALGDSAERPHFIETLPKHGYRFLATASESAKSAPVLEKRARLVVLPFANLGGDPAEEYLGDAMADEIITALCQVAPEQLAVIARTTAMHYKGSEKDVAHIGRELGVEYVVEGGVRRSAGQVAVNVQLIQVPDQAHVFAGKYEVEMREVFGIQNRIAKEIATHIPSVSGLGGGGRARRKPTEDLVAYQLYLRGHHHIEEATPESLAKAKEFFEGAIARDPQFALAYAALSDFYYWMGFLGYVPPRQTFSAGLWAALRAVEIDPTLAETHGLLGTYHHSLDYNWREVRRELTLALELDPSSPDVRFRKGVSELMPLGRLEEALRQLECGLEFDPLSQTLHCWLSVVLWLARDYDRAMREARVYQDLSPDFFLPPMMIGNIYRDSGRFPEAIAAERHAVELSGGTPYTLGWLGLALGQSGNTAEARSLLLQLKAMAAQAYVLPTCFAWTHIGLGEIDEAFHWMARAIDERDPTILALKTLPYLDPLRGDSRYLALLRQMNLDV